MSFNSDELREIENALDDHIDKLERQAKRINTDTPKERLESSKDAKKKIIGMMQGNS